MTDKNANPSQSEHRHCPSIRSTFLGKFFDFLLHSKSLYFSKDNTAKCAHCGAFLSVPKAYYHPLWKCSIFLVSAGLYYAAMTIIRHFRGTDHAFLTVTSLILGMAVCLYAFIRVTNAIIFAIGPWRLELVGDEQIEHRWAESSAHRNDKLIAILWGWLIARQAYGYGTLVEFLCICSLVGITVALVRKNMRFSISGLCCLVYSAIIFLLKFFWAMNVPIILTGIIPFVLICAVLYNMFALRQFENSSATKKAKIPD